jgi:MFS family permease
MRHAAVPAWIRALKSAPFGYHAVANLWRSRPAKTPRAVIAGLLAADVAFAFQQTAVVPAIHSVEQSLGASREWSAWLITVHLIVATIATPAMGRLADLYGRRRLLLIGLGVFTAGSVGAAFAPDTAMLSDPDRAAGLGFARHRRPAPARGGGHGGMGPPGAEGA